MMKIRKKELGIAKFGSEVDYIPGSVKVKPELTFPNELKGDEETQAELLGWTEDVQTFRKAMAKRCERQGKRNIVSMKETLKKDVIRSMIEIGKIVAGRNKILKVLEQQLLQGSSLI